MESQEINLSTQTTTPPQTPNLEQEPTTPKKKSNFLVLSLFVVILCLLSSTSFFAYYYFQPKTSTKVTNTDNLLANAQTPQPTISPETRAINPTTNWLTYEKKMLGISFKYPQEYNITTFEGKETLNRNITWVEIPQSIVDIRGDGPIIVSKNDMLINGIMATKFKLQYGDVGGSPHTSIYVEIPTPNSKILAFNLSEIKSNSGIKEELNEDEVKIFDQILSTFEFTDIVSSTNDFQTYSSNQFSFEYPNTGTVNKAGTNLDLDFNCSNGKLTEITSQVDLKTFIASSNRFETWQYNDYVPQKWKYEDLQDDPFQVDDKETIFVGPSGVGETEIVYFKNEDTIYSFNLQPKYGEGIVPSEDIECEPTNLSYQILSSFEFTE